MRRGVAVKICGVCSASDAALAAAAGADYLGVILAPGRSRTRTSDEAAVIFAASPTRRVGVFVDASSEEILRAVERLGLDVVQLHGRERPGQVEEIARSAAVRVWKAVAVRAAADIDAAAAAYHDVAHGLLLEGWSERGAGGVGARFDWHAVAGARERIPPGLDVIVAGGLDAQNVGRAIEALRPSVVDVSSGVEDAPCSKSAERTRAFITAARAAAALRGTPQA